MSQTLTAVSDVNPTFMDTEVKATAMREIAVLEGQLAAVRLSLLADAQDVAMEDASRDAGVWLAHHARTGHAAAKADLRLATELDRRRLLVASAMRAGTVNVAQARVICTALGRLPADVPAEIVAEAEAHLVGAAEEFGPEQLAKLGRKILEVVAPEIADAADAKALAGEEADAFERIRATLRRRGNGITRLSADLPDHVATRLAVFLEAHTNPRKKNTFGEAALPDGATADDLSEALAEAAVNTGALPDSSDPVERLPYPRRLGLALCAFLEAVDPRRLPIHGGDATTMLVTIRLEDLKKDLASGEVLTTAAIGGDPHGESRGGGEALTAGQIRRLACNARIIPAVLGDRSEILDLGRSRRFFTAAQRKALLFRDRTCRAEGCDIPGTWAEAHHWIPWLLGGKTDLKDGVLLCSHHHHQAHDDRYLVTRLPSGDVRFSLRR